MNRSPLRFHLIVLGLYSLLAIILSWPMVANLGRAVPGAPQWAFDESTFVWNVWYFKHALVDNLSNPLHSELIWYPLGIDLILYTYNFFHALIALPLAIAFNLPLASNLALLLSTVLSGYGTFLLVRYLLGRDRALEVATDDVATASSPGWLVAAIIAGIVYAFASNRAIYAALGHYDMVTTQWIPFYALMLLRMLDGRLHARARRKAAMLAGLFFAFNGLAEMITALFLAIFTLLVLADYGLTLWRSRRSVTPNLADDATKAGGASPANLRSAGLNLLLLGGVAFLIWSPALVPILVQFLTDDFSLKGWGEAIPLSTDLLGWFTPTILHPIFGGDLVEELRRVQLRALEQGVEGFRDVNTVFLGWVTLALALIGALAAWRKARVWIWTAILFGLFTLGPFLQINGRYRFDLDGVEATFPMPYALLHYIPIIKANRAPNRNSVLLMLALAVLVAYGIKWILSKRAERSATDQPSGATLGLPRLMIAVALALLILFEHLAVPAPLSDARIPGVYAEIAADPAPVSVLQIPLGWRNSFGVLGPERTQLQYFQTAHGKPMLGGNISRAPDFKMDYFARIPYFAALTEIEFGNDVPEETLAAAREQADDLIYLYNTGYVLLFPPIPQRFPYADHWEDAWAFVKETLPLEEEPFWEEEGIEAYRVVQPPGGDSFSLDLGTPGTYPYRGEGWDAAEVDEPYAATATWATEEESRLFLPLRNVDPEADYTVRIQVHPFAYPGSSDQSVALRVNDLSLDSHTLTDEWQTVTWSVPGSALENSLNRLVLTWDSSASPRTVLLGDRQIGSTGISLPIDADLKSFQDGAFIALFDDSGEQIDASAGRAGVNVTVLDPQSGDVVQMAGFDTTSNEFESQALADFLGEIDSGVPVLVAARGDATAFLTDAAIDALKTIGADVSRDALSDNYFAIVGVKSSEPGTASQQIDANDAFLSVSLNRDRRELAAAVNWVEIGLE